jgi:hypothetical protein
MDELFDITVIVMQLIEEDAQLTSEEFLTDIRRALAEGA